MKRYASRTGRALTSYQRRAQLFLSTAPALKSGASLELCSLCARQRRGGSYKPAVAEAKLFAQGCVARPVQEVKRYGRNSFAEPGEQV